MKRLFIAGLACLATAFFSFAAMANDHADPLSIAEVSILDEAGIIDVLALPDVVSIEDADELIHDAEFAILVSDIRHCGDRSLTWLAASADRTGLIAAFASVVVREPPDRLI